MRVLKTTLTGNWVKPKRKHNLVLIGQIRIRIMQYTRHRLIQTQFKLIKVFIQSLLMGFWLLMKGMIDCSRCSNCPDENCQDDNCEHIQYEIYPEPLVNAAGQSAYKLHTKCTNISYFMSNMNNLLNATFAASIIRCYGYLDSIQWKEIVIFISCDYST